MKVGGFEALGTLGYGFPPPFGVTVGLDLGYTLPFGLRIGADASNGFGRKVEDTRSSSVAFGGSLGYDLLLPPFRLRGAVDMGLALFSFDGGHVTGAFVPGGAWYIGPKVALLWQYRKLELGLQTKYWATDGGGVVQLQLMGGLRF